MSSKPELDNMPKFKAGDVARPKDIDMDGDDDVVILHVGDKSYFVKDAAGEMTEYSRGIEYFDRYHEHRPEAWEIGKRYVRKTGGPVIEVIALAEDGACLARSSGISALWALEGERREFFREAMPL